jgi:hypothetical protein
LLGYSQNNLGHDFLLGGKGMGKAWIRTQAAGRAQKPASFHATKRQTLFLRALFTLCALVVSLPAWADYSLVYSETAERAGSMPLAEAVVVGDLYARLLPEDGGIEQVRFYLDGSGSVLKTERRAPYDLQGGSSSAATPFDTTDLADGAHTLRSLVDLRDGSQLSFETTFTVANDGSPNDAPQLASIGDQALLVGDSAALLISASDANGDLLSFSSSALPAFASMSDNGDGTAILTLTPGVGDLGDHSITVNVSDGQLNDSETFIVSVSEPLGNLAPQLNPIGNQALLVGESAVVAITASDLNGDPLSFTSSLLPAFASFIDNGNGTASLILAPGATDVGAHSLTVSVSDGELEASETFDIIVNEPPPNVAPVLGVIGNQNLQAGDSTTLLIVASDANGDPLSFSTSALPAFASFNDNGNGTASLILAPGVADVGTHSLTVSVSDGELDDSESFEIIVSEAPASPYWLVYSETADRAGSILLGGAVVVGDLYARLLPEDGSIEQVRFYLDGSGSVLKTERKVPYDLQGGPSSAANPFDTTDLADGAHTLRSLVDLRDGSQLSFETTFTVANDGPLNRAPVLNAIGAQSVQAGNMLELTLSASDPDGDLLTFSSDLLPGFAVLTDQGDGSASLSIRPLLDDVGSYSVTIRVSDGELDDAESFTLQVTALGSLPEAVEISEFMASNATTLVDGDGDYEDWIELHNVGVDPVNLAGWCLTDDVAVWNTWCFPSVSLDADGYLLVFASKKTGSAVPEELHANLKLGKSGEYLGLYRPDASLAHAYSPNFPAQSDDISYGVSDAGQLRYFVIPTPGAANGVGLSDALSFDAASLSLSAQVGDATSVQVNLLSLQGGASGYALAVDDGGLGWLSAVVASGEDDLTPDLLDITANAAALAAGSYTAIVTASAADHASAVLTVNFTVSDGGSVLETVEISEFMASNATTLVDGDGDYEDWIELHNTGASALDLLNWCLTDDSADLFQWCFTESVSLAAGGHLVVFASGKSPAPAGQYHTLFKLSAGGEYLALVRPDGTIADEYAPAYPPQTTDVSYGIDDNGAEAFFLMPTPGEANGSGGGSGEPLSLSVERGFYDAPFQVTVSSDDSVELVRYTTDGSEPTLSNGLDYTGPVDITTTTVLRVAGFSSGVVVGRVQSHSYLFLEDVIRQPATVPGYPNNSYSLGQGSAVHDYEMDPDIVDDPNYSGSMIAAMRAVPSMSISIDPTDIFGGSGFYETEDIEKAVSLEILYADDPGASHQANAGIQSHSHNRLKRSLRLNFRALYGDAKFKSDLLDRAPLNGATADGKYDKLILRAGNNRSWARSWHPDETTYTVDQFYRDTQIAASGHGMRGTYVHLYINGLYWGLYNATERADKHFLSSYFGGADEHWFAANHGLVHDNAPPLSGDPTRYNYLTETLIYRDMSDPFNYAELQDYLEVDPFIDYLLVSWWSATNDWPDNNWYAGNRNETAPEDTTGLMYFAWDGEAAWDTPQDFGNPSGKAKIHPAFLSSEDVNSVGDAFVIARIWHAARQNADFMARFSTRVDELTGAGGALDDTVARARWMTLANFVREAVIGESARWGDAVDPNAPRTRDGAWQQEVDKIYDILGGNAAELRSQLAAEGFIP